MRKSFLGSLIVILLSISSFAQNYKIQDFIADSLTSWQIYGKGEFRGQYEEEKSNDKENNERDSEYASELRLTPWITYKLKRLRPFSERKLNIRSRFNLSRVEREFYRSISKGKGLDLNFSYIDINYFKNKIGYGLRTYGSLNLDNSNNDIDVDNSYRIESGDSENKYRDYEINIYPGISYGRIYDGHYAAKAMEIIDEIRDQGLLNRELNTEEFRELSQIVMNRKASYHYDSRIKKIEALNAIIDYLTEIGAVSPDSYSAAFILQDLYSYGLIGRESDRKFGFKTYTRLLGRYSSHKVTRDQLVDVTRHYYNNPDSINEKYTEDEYIENKKSHLSGGLQIGMDYYRIENWHFYYNFGLDLKIYNQNSRYKDIDTSYRYYSIPDKKDKGAESIRKDTLEQHIREITFTNDFYYKFSSRSIFVWKNNISYKYGHKIGSEGKQIERYELTINPRYVYYITPKFRISAGISYQFYKRRNNLTFFSYWPEDLYRETWKNHDISGRIQIGYYF